MDWFLYDNGLRHERVNDIIGSLVISANGYVLSDVRNTLSKTLKCHGKASLFSKYLNLTLKRIRFYKFTFLSVRPGVRKSHKMR